MPKYAVTAPDGKIYDVNAPDGATEQDAISYVQTNLYTPATEPVDKPALHDVVGKDMSLPRKMLHGAMGGIGGGPLGIITGAGKSGLEWGDKTLGKVAYGTGDVVTGAGVDIGLPPEMAAKAGYAANVGIQAIPALAGGWSGKFASPSLQSNARKLMQSALKPTLKDLKSGNAATAIQTMLDEGLNATGGGVMKLKDMIYKLNDEIKLALSNSGGVVSKDEVGKSLQKTLDKFSKQVNPQSDIAAIRKSWDEFLNHPGFKVDSIPVRDAQELKQGTYRVLDKKYGQLGTAETEAQKSLARGLKEEISKAVPEIAGLNAQESKLISTLNVVERRALMELNKNPLGLSLLSHNPINMAAYMADKSALFKSLAARMLNAGQERIPQAAAGVGIAVGEGANQFKPQNGLLGN